MPLTAEEIRNRRFTTVRIREGYEIEEVDAFLTDVQDSIDHYVDLAERLLVAVNSVDTGQAPPPEDHVAEPGSQNVVADTAVASRAAARILEAASAEAETLLSEARSRAEALVQEARAEADLVRVNSEREQVRLREETERRRSEALEAFAAERENLRTRLVELRSREESYRREIADRLRTQLAAFEFEAPAPTAVAAAAAEITEPGGYPEAGTERPPVIGLRGAGSHTEVPERASSSDVQDAARPWAVDPDGYVGDTHPHS